MALATALTCDSCHAGSGTGTTTHYINANARIGVPSGPATVAIDLIFTPKTGGNPAFTGTALTCSNVSCHGGQVTPGWQNGTINSGTQCTVCHAVAATAGTTTQFNDAFGRHSIGTHDATNSANSIVCTTCHNMGNGSPGALAHFKYLNTNTVDGVSTGTPADQMPSGTIVFDPAIVSAPGTYTVTSATQGNGSCALTCHTHIHTVTVDTWTASGAPHPVPFLAANTDTLGNGHLTATQATFAADCGTCHAYSGTTPKAGVPLCVACHALADPTVAATGVGTCLSCHAGSSGMPAGPTGAAFPNIAGAHAKHMGLPTTLTCDTCHAGSGTGTATHYANANARVTAPTGPASVSIGATYNAQSGGVAGQGAAVFNPSSLSCNTVSCHGGQATPNWQTGTISSVSQCTLCHAINSGASSSQFNDAIGRHSYGTHSNASALDCTLCHDMTTANTNAGATNHFAELNTPAVSSTNKLPSGTVKFKLTNATYPITGPATYTISVTTPEGDGGCALTCHNQNHDPVTNHWGAPKGSSVAHPVPFLSTDVSTAGNHHQTVTLAQFNSECSTCHDPTGTTTKTGPVCTVCHALGSPVATGMTAGTCLSCHAGTNFTTMGPTGTAWPNLTGAHPKHLALQTFTRTTPALPTSLTASAYPDCEACHVGSVPGDATNTHYSNANLRITPHSAPASVAIDPAFNSQASTAGITASASAFTCSNISCHGGQATPGWQTGTNPVNATTYCTACHVVGAAEYNAPTGRHSSSEHRQTCDYCHDMTRALPGAQNHFKYLDTTVVSGVSGTPSDQYPSDTILFGSVPTGAKTYTVTGSGNAQGAGGCALSCHGETHTTSGNHWN
jgi:predicted CxxxxCH...CXXCH cytochrome family protein